MRCHVARIALMQSTRICNLRTSRQKQGGFRRPMEMEGSVGWSEGPSLFRERSGATPRQVSNAKILRMTTKVGLNLRIFFFEKIHNILLWNFFFRNQANEEKEQAIDALEPGSLRNWIGSILEQRTGGYRRHVVGVDSSVFPRGMPVHVKRCQCQLIRTLGFVGFQYLFFLNMKVWAREKWRILSERASFPLGFWGMCPFGMPPRREATNVAGAVGWRLLFDWGGGLFLDEATETQEVWQANRQVASRHAVGYHWHHHFALHNFLILCFGFFCCQPQAAAP